MPYPNSSSAASHIIKFRVKARTFSVVLPQQKTGNRMKTACRIRFPVFAVNTFQQCFYQLIFIDAADEIAFDKGFRFDLALQNYAFQAAFEKHCG